MVERSVPRVHDQGLLAFLGGHAESFGFWASVAGLLLVVVVTVVNLAAPGPDSAALAAAEARIATLEARDAERIADIARLKAEIESVTSRVDSLVDR